MRKNSSGFTLIELLSVVTLIVLISLIVIPNVVSNINKKKGELSEANMKLLSQATDVYIGNHSASYTNSFEADGSVYCIPIQSLINDGVLETPFKDVSGDEIDYSDIVKATYNSSYNGFLYEKVNRSSCTEFINFVSRPVLADNMIPVINDDGSWKKADVNSKWYSYSDKKWANAVVVKEFKSDVVNSHSRHEYLESPAGTVINEDDILGYFVWIPRFKYQLFDSNTPVSINIVFEGVGSSKSNGTQGGQWLTHPAFTYKDKELSGVWVGKYEAGNSDDNIVVKSGNAPWTNIDYVSANDLAIQMTNENNIYGLKNVNTHMTRNSEWGAVAYLTNSIYGNNQNNTTTGNVTGIYNLSGNKEFVLLDNQDESSLGYALNETKNWSNSNSYTTNENIYLTRGNNSIFSYNNSKVMDSSTTFRISLTNLESQDDLKIRFLLMAIDVSYDNTNTGFKDSNGNDVVNVQTALDELYKLFN